MEEPKKSRVVLTPEERLERRRATARLSIQKRRNKDKEATRETERNYYRKHKKARLEAKKRWRLRNIEDARLRQAKRTAEYNKLNRDRVLEQRRLRYAKHCESIKEASRLYRAAHPEKNRGRKRSPEQKRSLYARHRAHKAAAPVNDLTAAQWAKIKIAFGHCCAYCDRQVERLTMDHIMPISQGGANTIWNVVPACQSCNSKKHTGPPLCPVQPLLLVW